MREYQFARLNMTEKMQQAEHMRLVNSVTQPLHKRFMVFLRQSLTTQSERKPMTATQQFKATTSHS